MKTIFNFDSALENMGFSIVLFNDEWKSQLAELNEQLKSSLQNTGFDQVFKTLGIIDKLLDNIITITHCNVIDLIPEINTSVLPIDYRTKKLKFFLTMLDRHAEQPDIVLIEYQMKQNTLSRAVSNQIMYHYQQFDTCEVKFHDNFVKEKKRKAYKTFKTPPNYITCSINDMLTDKMINNITCNTYPKRIVDMVGCTLKNSFFLKPAGEYQNYIMKYSNYTANKKHSTDNFKYFLQILDTDKYNTIYSLKNKADDIADTFMMCFGWLKKNNLL